MKMKGGDGLWAETKAALSLSLSHYLVQIPA